MAAAVVVGVWVGERRARADASDGYSTPPNSEVTEPSTKTSWIALASNGAIDSIRARRSLIISDCFRAIA